MYGSKTTVVVTCSLLHVQSDLHACMHTSFRPSINSKVQINRGRHLHSGIKHRYIKLLVNGA